jgi:penicillin-binding protein A
VNPPIRRLAVVVSLLFLGLLLNVTFVQVLKASDYKDRPGNTRLILAEYNRQRGAIIVGGAAVASSKATNDQLKYLRVYSSGPAYAPATGFYSLVYGATALERAENSLLTGSDNRLFVRNLGNLATGQQPKGGSVVLTLDAAAQKAAYQGLAGRRGAVVALDPSTGAILALATSPSYDPNLLSSHNSAAVRKAYGKLTSDAASPMLDRALAQTYPPGSTFKLVTAAAALSSGKFTKDTVVPGPQVLKLPQTTAGLVNEDHQACGPNGTTTVENALRISCNTAFGGIGLSLGQGALSSQARKFGFDSPQEVPLRAATSRFPDRLNPPQTAQSAIGQFDVQATPLQMAMVAAGIANRGVVMKPYLVSELRAPDLSVLQTTQPQQLSTAVTPQVAAELTQMMVTVVNSGTGTNGAIPGVTVAGKTGTAQVGGGKSPHAWFVSFAPAENPRVAVAVVIENGGGATEVSGNQLAAPVARAVMRAVLGK